MTPTTEDLELAYLAAEAQAQALMAEKDQALQAVKDKYTQDMQDANNQASKAQKEWLDAQAAEALTDRPDGPALAEALGLTMRHKVIDPPR